MQTTRQSDFAGSGKDKARMNLMQISKSISNQKKIVYNGNAGTKSQITIKKCSIMNKNPNRKENSRAKLVFKNEINGDSMLNFTQVNKENLENFDPSS